MAEAFLQILLEKLNSLIQTEVELIWGVDKEMKKLSSLLSTIQAVLEDAEEKQIKDKAIQNWLRKLKDAAYKVDDILDECVTEASRLESEGQRSRLINKVHSSFLNRFRPDNIIFCRKIGNKMKEIRERLDEIAEERIKFHLNEVIAERQTEVTERRQTGSIITQSHVYGRDEDNQMIVEYLVKNVACCDEISIYPILGIGGLGKTTVAQMVFNDERVKRHFELRIWVCISNDFSVKRIIKAIIESATGSACEDLDLDPLQRRLQEILNGKRYLLILDDVWNEDQEKWDKLKHVLACGSKGASIVVTTRIKRVASIMGTLPLHQLSGLTEDDCWSLFRERAFKHQTEERPSLVALGKEIVKKCGGVPLAVKSLGSLMRYKDEEHQWISVKESKLWNLPQDENSILPALQLSYYNLPSNIRQCFAYCAIFPKDFSIEKEDLIYLWMANGFISSTGNLEPEDIGNEICNELYWRSFFQDAEKDYSGKILTFKMHDLVHDLAQSIMGDECYVAEMKPSDHIPKQFSHVTVDADRWQSYRIWKDLHEVETLRTFRVQPLCLNDSSIRYALEFSCDFTRLTSLRVFGARKAILSELSSSISLLKHLRYLDISSTPIQILPASVCTLFNLQTLILSYCCRIRELPKHMRRLKNLRHLYLDGCTSLSEMPPKIGQITCLKTLTLFVVGERGGCHLAELKRLNLGGTLRIERLDKVSNLIDAKEANLVGKPNLRSLYLSWGDDNDTEIELQEKVLEALEPHPNLEHLLIEGYKGSQLPLWVRDQILSDLVSLELSGCKNCSQLPPLGKQPSLRDLAIRGMNQVLYIDHNLQSGGVMKGFPSLVNLTLADLPSLQRLSREDGRELFPSLTNLDIKNCSKLTLPCLPSVKRLDVLNCNEVLLASISNLRSLSELSVTGNEELVSLPHSMLRNLTSLHSLEINKFSKFKELPAEEVSLQSLTIANCSELESFPQQWPEGLNCLRRLTLYRCEKFTTLSEGLQHLFSLESLTLKYCPELVDLPDGIGQLTSLRYLKIHECTKLSSLPSTIRSLTKLQELVIVKCPELEKRCEKETGEDWYKIAHVPTVYISPC